MEVRGIPDTVQGISNVMASKQIFLVTKTKVHQKR